MWGRKLSEGGKKLADYGFSRPHASKVLKMNLWSVLEDDFWTLSSPAPLPLHLTINFVHEKLIFSKIIINFFCIILRFSGLRLGLTRGPSGGEVVSKNRTI